MVQRLVSSLQLLTRTQGETLSGEKMCLFVQRTDLRFPRLTFPVAPGNRLRYVFHEGNKARCNKLASDVHQLPESKSTSARRRRLGLPVMLHWWKNAGPRSAQFSLPRSHSATGQPTERPQHNVPVPVPDFIVATQGFISKHDALTPVQGSQLNHLELSHHSHHPHALRPDKCAHRFPAHLPHFSGHSGLSITPTPSPSFAQVFLERSSCWKRTLWEKRQPREISLWWRHCTWPWPQEKRTCLK